MREKLSETHRKRIGDALRGKKKSKEHIEKLRISCRIVSTKKWTDPLFREKQKQGMLNASNKISEGRKRYLQTLNEYAICPICKCQFKKKINNQKYCGPKCKTYYDNHEYKNEESIYKYNHSDKFKETYKRFMKTKKGKELLRKKNAAKRKMRYIQLMDNPVPNNIKIVYHHINDMFTMPIPEQLHLSHSGMGKQEHRKQMNKIVEDYLGINLNLFLSE